jgi:hypothetical protein
MVKKFVSPWVPPKLIIQGDHRVPFAAQAAKEFARRQQNLVLVAEK